MNIRHLYGFSGGPDKSWFRPFFGLKSEEAEIRDKKLYEANKVISSDTHLKFSREKNELSRERCRGSLSTWNY